MVKFIFNHTNILFRTIFGRRKVNNGANFTIRLRELYTSEYSAASVQEKIRLLFNSLKNPDTDKVQVPYFLAQLKKTGLLADDPRLHSMLHEFKVIEAELQPHFNGIDAENFARAVETNIAILTQAFERELVVEDFETFCKEIELIYNICIPNRKGIVASYIPQLSKVNPELWSVSVCTTDGQRFSIGDSKEIFTIQSCSKPIIYGIALDLLGSEVVHQYIGKEPSGRIFNELFLNSEKKPHNPMINAGAIVVCSLLDSITPTFGKTASEKFENLLDYFSRLAGGKPLGFSNTVYLSELESADRNYAIAYYMKENKCFPQQANLHEVMKFYFRSCSLEITTDLLAIIAASLAKGGVCPLTNERLFIPLIIRRILSLMYSCGMYDYSGEFAFEVGIPAKSAVSGAMMLVIQDVMGVALYSPRLDRMGNSVRGLQFSEEMDKRFNFHKYDSSYRRFDFLRQCRKNYIDDPNNAERIFNLNLAAANGDLSTLRKFYLMGSDMNSADYDKRTPLHLAAAEGKQECAEFLVRIGRANINAIDRFGRTPLDEAERGSHSSIVSFFESSSYVIDKNSGVKNEKPTDAASYDQNQNLETESNKISDKKSLNEKEITSKDEPGEGKNDKDQ